MRELSTNNVIVTGALGWLGTRLVHALVQGLPDCPGLSKPRKDLRILCLALPGQDTTQLKQLSERIEVLAGDIRNPADCERLCAGRKGAVLFHTAGIIHPRRVRDFYDINLRGTTHLLDAAIAAGIKRAIIVSSNSPCGCNPHPDHLFDELSPYHPYFNYGRSKMQMEQAVNDRQKAGKIETSIVRPPWFYGPNQPPRQSLFFKMVREGKAPIVGSGTNLRSMCYLDNLSQGLLLAAMTENANGKTYWIADARPYSMNEIIDTIENLMEMEFGYACAHRRLRLPSLASEAALVADGILQSAGLYHQKIHVLSEMNKTIACSITRAEEELGYRPAISLEEGIRRSLIWCREHGIQLGERMKAA